MKHRVLAFSLGLGLAGIARGQAAPPASPLWRALDAGPHAVGFRVIEERDPGRRLPDRTVRPVQISLWYPALPSPGAALTYGDYVAVAAGARGGTPLDAAGRESTLAAYVSFLEQSGVPPHATRGWLATPLAAVREAPPASARFPLVAIAQGNGGAVHDQALLGEYLASHGYLVLTTPSPLRLGATMESDRDVLPVAREQAADLALALRRVDREPTAESARHGLVGYSFGARAALLLAAAPGTRALVSLDGGIGTASGGDWLPPSALDRSRVTCPILHVFEDTEDFMTPDLTLLASLRRSPRTLLRIEAMHHLDLVTFGMAAAELPGMGPDPGEAKKLAARARAAFRYARAFLDANVKGTAEGGAFLLRDPGDNGYPPGLLTRATMKAR